LNGQRIRGVLSPGKQKFYGGKDLPKSQVQNTERVREDERGDSEDDEDDELPCVIGCEGEGDCV